MEVLESHRRAVICRPYQAQIGTTCLVDGVNSYASNSREKWIKPRTGEYGSFGSCIAVKVRKHHFPDVEVERDVEARLKNVVHVGTRSDNDLLCLEDRVFGLMTNSVNIPSVMRMIRRLDSLDLGMLFRSGAIVQ